MPSYWTLSNFHSLWGLFAQQSLHIWLVWALICKRISLLNYSKLPPPISFLGSMVNFTNKTDGVAMGSPHGLLIANVFMCHLEEILTRDDLIPHLYKRYVDDTLARMPSTAAAVVFPITLYSLHSSLTFTMELLTVDKISFYFLLNLRLKFTKNQQTLICSLPINPIETLF